MVYLLSYLSHIGNTITRRSVAQTVVNSCADRAIRNGATHVRIEYIPGPDDVLLSAHFTPGNVILSNYWREYDRVIEFIQTAPGKCWSVRVRRCNASGEFMPGEPVRMHSTHPDRRDLIIARLA